MGFVQTGFLLGLLAIAVPVIVHLLSRWQVRRLELGTMRFLQEVIQHAAHRRRIRRWLLLITRMALIVLLVALFARPFLPQRSNQSEGRIRIVLIDRSASMMMPGQNGRLLDDAIVAAVQWSQRDDQESQVVWAWFDHQVEPMPAGTTRPTTTRSISGDTDYRAAITWARDRLLASPNAEAEVCLITDLQQSGLEADRMFTGENDELNFPEGVPFFILDVGRTEASNLAILGLAAETKRGSEGERLTVASTVFNFGTIPGEDVAVTALATNGQTTLRLKKTLNVESEQVGELQWDFGIVEPSIWEVTVDIDAADDLTFDNRRLAAVEVVAPKKVLVIDPGSESNPGTAASYFLTTALGQGLKQDGNGADAIETTRLKFDVQTWFVEGQGEPGATQVVAPLVVIADAGTVSVRMIDTLETYVRDGGRLLVFAGQSIDAQTADVWRSTGLAPGQLSNPERAAAMPFRIVAISNRGSMLEPFRDPQHGDLGRLAFVSRYHAKVEDESKVLAWFDGERPAITEQRLDQGRVAWFLSCADSRSGDWTTSPLYLPLVHQMAGDLLGLTGEGPVRFRGVGDAKKDGQNLEYDQPGFYNDQDALVVVNTLAKESDPSKIEAQAIADTFGLSLAVDSDQPRREIDTTGRKEYWQWLAVGLLVLLVTEFGLANRTPA